MDTDSIPLWIIFVICVIGGAYFAATESSFSAVNKIRIKSLADDGNRSAKGVLSILNRFDKALTTLLIGNNITKIAGASVFTILATDIFRKAFGQTEEFLESFAFSMICSVLSTVVIFLFSEMIPKSFANDRSESVSLFFEGSLRVIMKILTPLSAIFGFITNVVNKLFANKELEPSITEEELTEIIETAEEEGVVDEEQGDMLKSVLEFSKTTVDEIMTMERDIEMINVDASAEEVLELIQNTVHSRLLVKAANSGRIVGVLRVRTFITEYKKNPHVRVRSLMTAPYIVHEDTKIDALLSHMRQHKIHIAAVVDSGKKVVGLVTIEDILEELVGEIFDEEDIVDQNYQPLGGNKYLVNTRMLMLEVYDRMGLGKAPRAVANKPILSFIIEQLGHQPEEGESFIFDNLEITAETMNDGKVVEVVIHILDEDDLKELEAVREEMSI